MLELRNLYAGYGPLEVVRNIDLHVGQGECVALIGWSGAGKTTLLKTIAGIIRPVRGDILYRGRNIVGTPPQDRVRDGMVLVPEGRRLFTGMTVMENLLVGAHTVRDKAAVTTRFTRIYDLFPVLRERRYQVVGTLSGGEQQMCAIGRALMSAPQLVLIDELSLGLAPLVVERLLAALMEIRASGATILLVEQSADLALSLANRGYVLRQGVIAKSGKSSELIHDRDFGREYLGQ